MTKLEKLKKEIGYTKEAPTCQVCEHFTSDISYRPSAFTLNDIKEEKNIRCGLYCFATKKTTYCESFARKG
jgi:hypothetical protein